MNTELNREQWIDVRRNALFDYFEIPEKEMPKVNAVFDKMRALADECQDQAEFENRMANSPITTEYNNLFSSMSRYVKGASGMQRDLAKQIVKDSVKGYAETQARGFFFRILLSILPSWITDWWIYRGNNIDIVRKLNTFKSIKSGTIDAYERRKKYEQKQKEMEPEIERIKKIGQNQQS